MFKKPVRKRKLRKRDSDDEEEEVMTKARMDDIRDIQKARARPSGLTAAELALGTEAPDASASTEDDDPLTVGGLLDLKSLKKGKIKKASLEDSIKGNFSKESSLRDEDEEMRKYVEAEIARRKGLGGETSAPSDGPGNTLKDWEDALYALPDHLKKYQSKKNEEMLSNQMLVGIPEVDLGMDAKIRNIEETEATKLRLLREAQAKKRSLEEATSYNQDLVKDLACDYVQHHQFNIARTTDLGQEGRSAKKKELEEVMADADAQKVLGEKAVPYMLADEHELDEQDRIPADGEGFYAD